MGPGFVATNFGHRDQRWLQSMLVLMRPLLARDSLQVRAVSHMQTSSDCANARVAAFVQSGVVTAGAVVGMCSGARFCSRLMTRSRCLWVQGAMTQIFAATSPELEGKGGL